jgi:hypothetical protein
MAPLEPLNLVRAKGRGQRAKEREEGIREKEGTRGKV